MTVTTDLKKTATDTGYAVVGATDLAVERVRDAQARAAAVRAEIELKRLQGTVKQLPTLAISTGVDAANKVEETFDELAERGRVLVQRIRTQRATQELVKHGRNTVSRGKAAVTTARRGAKDTKSAAKATVTTAERELDQTTSAVKKTAAANTRGTKAAAKRTNTTARKRAASTTSATKATATTAKKTASAAAKATEAAAEKVGA